MWALESIIELAILIKKTACVYLEQKNPMYFEPQNNSKQSLDILMLFYQLFRILSHIFQNNLFVA